MASLIGYGTVGRATASSLGILLVYDKDPKLNLSTKEHAQNAFDEEVIYICVGTPAGTQGLDASQVHEVLDSIYERRKRASKPVIVIRSTLPLYFGHKIFNERKAEFIYWPEFGSNASMYEDMQQPALRIIGRDYVGNDAALQRAFPKTLPQYRVLSVKQAIMVKLAANAYFATKLMFFEDLYDLCDMHHIPYKHVAEAMAAHPWIGNSHINIGQDGYRGFGGSCLPKDTADFNAMQPDSKQTLVGRTLALNKWRLKQEAP